MRSGAMAWVGTALTALTVVVAVSGCGATASRQVPNPVMTTTAAPDGCPTSAAPTRLPADVTTRVPLPTGGTLISDTTTVDGLRVVRFGTTMSLRQGILFLLDRLPQAGFVLGRGDAEAFEADAPFASQDGTFRGAFRLTSTQPCVTNWLLAYAITAPGHAAPAIPTYKPTSPATPLPF